MDTSERQLADFGPRVRNRWQPNEELTRVACHDDSEQAQVARWHSDVREKPKVVRRRELRAG